jgi:integrase/recombinase XerD
MILLEEKFKLTNPVYISYLQGFDQLVAVDGYRSKHRKYQKAVLEFLHFCESKNINEIRKVKSVDLVSYHQYLSNIRENFIVGGRISRSYVASHMHCLNVFFEYLLQCKIIKGVVVLPSRPIGVEREITILTQDEISLIYNTITDKLERAFFSIAYGCGLRRSELTNLNVSDILWKSGVLIVRNGKNDKRREVPLSKNVLYDIKKYVFEDRDNYVINQGVTSAFFVSKYGKRMTGGCFYDRLKKILKRTKNEELQSKNITLHTLRHSISSHLIDNGANIEFVKNFLGHDDIDTSNIYIRHRKMKNIIIRQIN